MILGSSPSQAALSIALGQSDTGSERNMGGVPTSDSRHYPPTTRVSGTGKYRTLNLQRIWFPPGPKSSLSPIAQRQSIALLMRRLLVRIQLGELENGGFSGNTRLTVTGNLRVV